VRARVGAGTGELVAFAPKACRYAHRTRNFKGTTRWIQDGVRGQLGVALELEPVIV